MTQTMLLAKNLKDFLSKNRSSTIPTMLLLSPAGKLLSSSSSLPSSQLRTQATLSYSLWSLYLPSIRYIEAALPSSTCENGSKTTSSDQIVDQHKLSTITIQLTHGLMMIRALNCGLLFVAISISGATTSPPSSFSSATNAKTPPQSSRGGGNGNSSVNEIEAVNTSDILDIDVTEFKKRAEGLGEWLNQQLFDLALYEGEGRL